LDAWDKPHRLGDFEIVRQIGRGGMGVVYEARQCSLNRRVALKVLSSALGLTEKAVVRFRREAEAAAKLHHTNIVPIYATGEDLSEVTKILSAIEQGNPKAAEKLLPLDYDELRKLAAQKLAQEKPGQTLQATALVHEAYLGKSVRDLPAGFRIVIRRTIAHIPSKAQ
jgi:serine/threonine protein kinase